MQEMRAVVIQQFGGPEQLSIATVPVPTIAESAVLIHVVAAGINRADIHQREGHYPPPPGASDILGMEVSGHIAAVGEAVTRWKTGDRVCALIAGGGYAEYCAVPGTQCLPVPENISLVDAAGLPEAAFTVWANLFHQPLVHSAETLLIQGGSSGIGTFAIQAAKALGVTQPPQPAASRSWPSAEHSVPSRPSPINRTGRLRPAPGQEKPASTLFWI